MEALTDQLKSLKTTSPDAIALLKKLFVKTYLKKGMVLGASPYTVPHLYFMKHGLIKGCYVVDGIEYPSWVADHGFIPVIKAPSAHQTFQEFLELLEDSCVCQLNLDTAALLAETSKPLRQMLNEITDDTLTLLKEGEILLRMPNAAERFKKYMERNKEVSDKIHKDLLADLLHMSTKHLFKIRKDYLKSDSTKHLSNSVLPK